MTSLRKLKTYKIEATTENGSRYTLDLQGGRVCRLGPNPDVPEGRSEHMRGDGEWSALLFTAPIVVGNPLVMVLQLPGRGFSTMRITSPVTAVMEFKDLFEVEESETAEEGT